MYANYWKIDIRPSQSVCAIIILVAIFFRFSLYLAYYTKRDSITDEPFDSGRGSLWTDKERLWIPQIPDNREKECADRATISGSGVQSQKAMDEAAKKKA